MYGFPAAPPTSSRSPHAPITRSEILRRVEGLNKHWAHCGRNAAVQDNSRLTAPPDAESALDRHLSFTGPTLSPAATAATGERRERRTTPPRALAATLPYKPSAARAAPSVAEAVSTRPVMAAARRRLAARLAYGAKNQGGAGVADEVTPTTPHLDVAGVPPAASAASAGQC